MAYTHDDYITIEDTIQRERKLRLHIQEVSREIRPDVSKGGSSKATGSVMAYYQELKSELKGLVLANRGRKGRSVMSHANFNGAND